jgi:hypothetical protein
MQSREENALSHSRDKASRKLWQWFCLLLLASPVLFFLGLVAWVVWALW